MAEQETRNTVVSCSAIHTQVGGEDDWARDEEHSTRIDLYYLVPFRIILYYFTYLLPLGVILPTQAKCHQNHVKQLKQANSKRKGDCAKQK